MGKENWPAFYRRLFQDNGTAFRSAHLKIMRADHLLEELEIAIRVLPNNMHQSFVVGTNGPDKIRLIFKTGQMPLQLSAALGDCIHNIRSALDHIAVALTAPPIGEGHEGNAYFPTGRDKQAYEDARDRRMKGAPADALGLIDALEPWRGGAHLARELHELDVMDKHKLLVPAIAEMHIRSMGAEFDGTPITITGKDVQPVNSGQEFIIEVPCPGIKNASEFKLTNSLKADFSIKFARDHPCAGKLVLPTLRFMRNVVSDLAGKCETAFPGFASWRTTKRRDLSNVQSRSRC